MSNLISRRRFIHRLGVRVGRGNQQTRSTVLQCLYVSRRVTSRSGNADDALEFGCAFGHRRHGLFHPDALYSWRAGDEGAEWLEIHSGIVGTYTDRGNSGTAADPESQVATEASR